MVETRFVFACGDSVRRILRLKVGVSALPYQRTTCNGAAKTTLADARFLLWIPWPEAGRNETGVAEFIQLKLLYPEGADQLTLAGVLFANDSGGSRWPAGKQAA